MRIAVTGAAGFLGSALVRWAIGRGHRVVAIDDLRRGEWRRVPDHDRIERIELDVRDRAGLIRATRGCDAIHHLAAINGTDNFYDVPADVLRVGLEGALNVADAMAENGIRRLLFTSTSEVYHQPLRIPTGEDEPMKVPDPRNPRFSYSVSKIASEVLFLHGLPAGSSCTIVRPHNVYGPDMGFKHVIPDIVRKCVEAKASGADTIDLIGDPTAERSFLHVDDFVRAVELIEGLEHPPAIIHVGSEVPRRIADVAEEILGRVGGPRGYRWVEGHLGSPTRRAADTTLLRSLGFTETVAFSDGLARTIDAYVKDLPDLRVV